MIQLLTLFCIIVIMLVGVSYRMVPQKYRDYVEYTFAFVGIAIVILVNILVFRHEIDISPNYRTLVYLGMIIIDVFTFFLGIVLAMAVKDRFS